MSDLRWSTAFQGSNPQQDTDLLAVQPDPSTEQGTDPEQNADNYQKYLETELQTQLKTLRDKLDTICKAIYNDNGHGTLQLKSYTVDQLPSASPAGQFVYVTNEVGGAIPAFSDGTNWRRVSDRALVAYTP